MTVLFCHSGHRLFAFLRSRPLVYLGTISYGIYLYHHLIILSSRSVSDFTGISPGPALWTIECALTLCVAALSWHLIERPILRLKDRIPYQSESVSGLGQTVALKSSYHGQSLPASAAS